MWLPHNAHAVHDSLQIRVIMGLGHANSIHCANGCLTCSMTASSTVLLDKVSASTTHVPADTCAYKQQPVVAAVTAKHVLVTSCNKAFSCELACAFWLGQPEHVNFTSRLPSQNIPRWLAAPGSRSSQAA